MIVADVVAWPNDRPARRCSERCGIPCGSLFVAHQRRVIAPAAYAIGLMMCLGGNVAPARAQQVLPDTENGRYALANVQGAVIRLDTRTGKVTTCKNADGGWSCTIVPDEREAYDVEIGRLQASNDALKAQLAQQGSGQAEAAKPGGERKLEIPLPSDSDVDRVMTFVEKAWRRLVDIANRIQRGDAGRDGKL